jgi:CBS domain containing-hemolysin-like protein
VVFDERVDRIIGMVHAMEMLGVKPEQPIAPYMESIKSWGALSRYF